MCQYNFHVPSVNEFSEWTSSSPQSSGALKDRFFKPEFCLAMGGDNHSKDFSGNIKKILARPHLFIFPPSFIIHTNGIALSKYS